MQVLINEINVAINKATKAGEQLQEESRERDESIH